jgi:hypothetical protein
MGTRAVRTKARTSGKGTLANRTRAVHREDAYPAPRADSDSDQHGSSNIAGSRLQAREGRRERRLYTDKDRGVCPRSFRKKASQSYDKNLKDPQAPAKRQLAPGPFGSAIDRLPYVIALRPLKTTWVKERRDLIHRVLFQLPAGGTVDFYTP